MRSSNSPSDEQQQRRRRPLVLGAAALALVVFAAVLALLLTRDDDNGGSGRPSSSAVARPPFHLEAERVYAYATRFHAVEGLAVTVGDRLTFENRDDKPHTFTSDEGLFDSGPIAPDRRYAFAYSAPGTYHFHCEIHPTMKGSVVVVAAKR